MIYGNFLATIFNLIAILPALIIRIGLPVLVIIFLVKGIKYLNRKNKE